MFTVTHSVNISGLWAGCYSTALPGMIKAGGGGGGGEKERKRYNGIERQRYREGKVPDDVRLQ